jgi:hypothetical protein
MGTDIIIRIQRKLKRTRQPNKFQSNNYDFQMTQDAHLRPFGFTNCVILVNLFCINIKQNNLKSVMME